MGLRDSDGVGADWVAMATANMGDASDIDSKFRFTFQLEARAIGMHVHCTANNSLYFIHS